MKFSPITNKLNSESLLHDFEKSLISNLKELDFNYIEKSFSSNSTWTKFYKTGLLPKIAKDLMLNISDKEFLRVDYCFSHNIEIDKENERKEQWWVPVVFIESENDIRMINDGGDNDELFKLCCLNAPLKIIFTKDWDPNNITSYINEWQFSIDVFKEGSRLIGYLLIIIVINVTDKFQFHLVVWDDKGKVKYKDVIENQKQQL